MFVIWGAQFFLRYQGIGFISDSFENRVTDLQIAFGLPV